MASPLVSMMNDISEDFEASTPPDRPTVTYHEVDGKRFRAGTAGDRSFMFDYPTRGEPVGERGPSMTQVEWTLPIRLRLSTAGRSLATRTDSAANEVNQLMRTIELRSTWTSAGVLEVITEDAVPEADEKGSAVYTINIRALCEETD